MQDQTQIPASRAEILQLVKERKLIGEKLASAGGEESGFLIGLCEDLSDIIEEIGEITRKKDEKEHAAFETKIKFSRKVRRKAKDLGRFEQEIVQQFDQKHISLEHGRKMAGIIKTLKSGKAEKAAQEAAEFYAILEMGNRRRAIDEELARKSALVERQKRILAAKISELEWLDGQPAPDIGKAGRHEEGKRLRERLAEIRLEKAKGLEAMPLAGLVGTAKADALETLGFPAISEGDASQLLAFLHKSGLESKTAAQLFELAGQSEQKIRHLGIDLAGFRQEILGRKNFFSQIMALHAGDFLAIEAKEALDYLAGQSDEAKNAITRLSQLAATSEEDEREWKRKQEIEAKKTGLAGVEKPALQNSLKEMEALERLLDGREGAGSQQKRGMLDSLLGLFKDK